MNDEQIASRLAKSLEQHGYKVSVLNNDDGEISLAAEKGQRRVVVQFERYNGKGDLDYMTAVSRALHAGRVKKDYLITNDTQKDDPINRYTIHLPQLLP